MSGTVYEQAGIPKAIWLELVWGKPERALNRSSKTGPDVGSPSDDGQRQNDLPPRGITTIHRESSNVPI